MNLSIRDSLQLPLLAAGGCVGGVLAILMAGGVCLGFTNLFNLFA